MQHDDPSYKQLASLVKRAQHGDKDAFRQIYERTAQAQYFIIASKVGYAAADDILQEAYLTAWDHLNEIRPRSFVAYVRKVAERLCLRYFERTSHPRETSVATDDLSALDMSAALHTKDETKGDPAAKVDARDMSARLGRALREELDDREREALLLRYYQNMRIDDIAEAMELSASTVKRTIRAALDKLRDKLGVLPAGPVFAGLMQKAVETPLATGVPVRPAPLPRSWIDRAVPAVAAVAALGVIGCMAVAANLPRSPEPQPVETIVAEPAPALSAAPAAPADTTAPALVDKATEYGYTVLSFADETSVAEVRLSADDGTNFDPLEADLSDPTHPVFRFAVPSGTYTLRAADGLGNVASGSITVKLPPEEPVSLTEAS